MSVFFILFSSQVYAGVYQQLLWPLYTSGSSDTCSVSVSTNLNGNDSTQQAFNYFVGQGLTQNQSAGIVGNMWVESGVTPTSIQGGGNSQNPADAGGNGWGIVQWTPANTKAPAVYRDSHASGQIYELATQLQMVWAQLTGNAGDNSETQAGNDVKSTTTVEEAVRAFQGDSKIGGKYTGFERPQDEQATLQDRIDRANKILQNYSGSPGTTTVPGSNGCSTTQSGQDTQYVDNFPVYSQYNSAWANKPYGSSTIGDAGCGPSAMAMIITALTGQKVTPDQTAAYADSQGLYVAGAGSSWQIAPVLAAHWGLKAQPVGADIAKISAAIQSGGLVIVSGQGPLPFTTGGHYIVIRAVTADGKWKIGDSGHSDTSAQEWDPQQLLTSMNDGSAYAITK